MSASAELLCVNIAIRNTLKVYQTAALSRFNNRHHHTLNCRCGSTHIAKFHVDIGILFG